MNKPSKEEVDKAIKFFTELPTQTDKERIDWVVGFKVGATHEHETQVIPLREANDKLMIAAATLRERLEKVEKALKEARDVLVMASLIDKTSTCMDAVNEIDQLLTKEG